MTVYLPIHSPPPTSTLHTPHSRPPTGAVECYQQAAEIYTDMVSLEIYTDMVSLEIYTDMVSLEIYTDMVSLIYTDMVSLEIYTDMVSLIYTDMVSLSSSRRELPEAFISWPLLIPSEIYSVLYVTLTTTNIYMYSHSVVTVFVCLFVCLFVDCVVQGRFSMAARYHSNIAEICEGELADFEQVREREWAMQTCYSTCSRLKPVH